VATDYGEAVQVAKIRKRASGKRREASRTLYLRRDAIRAGKKKGGRSSYAAVDKVVEEELRAAAVGWYSSPHPNIPFVLGKFSRRGQRSP
jgi:hypothetical protein